MGVEYDFGFIHRKSNFDSSLPDLLCHFLFVNHLPFAELIAFCFFPFHSVPLPALMWVLVFLSFILFPFLHIFITIFCSISLPPSNYHLFFWTLSFRPPLLFYSSLVHSSFLCRNLKPPLSITQWTALRYCCLSFLLLSLPLLWSWIKIDFSAHCTAV